MQCRICGAVSGWAFDARILNKYTVAYFHCSSCGYLCTEDPYWLEEAYADALSITDTGGVARNVRAARRLRALLRVCFHDTGRLKWLDYGGGHGLLTRLMRDYGFDFYWHDKYASNIFARGFEGRPDAHFDGVTAMEVLEHSIDPLEFVSNAMAGTTAESLVFSTELYPGDTPPPQSWWYYSFVSGQHVSLFRYRTLAALAERLGLHLYSHRGLHLLTRRALGRLRYKLAAGPIAERMPAFLFGGLQPKTWTDHLALSKALQERELGTPC
jgi:hypothetical protein